jgi:hypothetical protein
MKRYIINTWGRLQIKSRTQKPFLLVTRFVEAQSKEEAVGHVLIDFNKANPGHNIAYVSCAELGAVEWECINHTSEEK